MSELNCCYCKKTLSSNLFLKSNQKYSKRCKYCREKALKYKNENLCDHFLQSNNCRKCYSNLGIKALKKWTITKMIYGSRKSDKNMEKEDDYEVNFIDYSYIENLIKICNNKCIYCNVDFNYKNMNGNMITIERINNKLTHTKNNTTLCCLTCNVRRVGSYT